MRDAALVVQLSPHREATPAELDGLGKSRCTSGLRLQGERIMICTGGKRREAWRDEATASSVNSPVEIPNGRARCL
jgi:hypothetical protein